MTGASDHLPRLLALVPWLLARPDTPVQEVANEFGVTEKQIRADLQLIFLCGLPGHGPGDLMDVVYDGDRVALSNADTISRPLRLTSEEALAIVAALRILHGVPGLIDTLAVDRALAKLEEAAGEAIAADDVTVSPDRVADATVVSSVADGIARARRLHLRYWVPARDEMTDRDVDPIRMFTADGAAYLVGWCRLVDDVRTFRLDRIVDIVVLDLPAEVPPDISGRTLSDSVFTPAADDRLVTIELDPRARWVADYYPVEELTQRDGTLVVRLRARDGAWIRRLALGLAGHARVSDPPDVARDVRRAAELALAAYEADGSTD